MLNVLHRRDVMRQVLKLLMLWKKTARQMSKYKM